jgi:hypothetical protein
MILKFIKEEPTQRTNYAGIIYDDDKVFIKGYNCLSIYPILGMNNYGFGIWIDNVKSVAIGSERIKAISKEYIYVDER